ncbi:MAG: hypothetical protein Q9216_001393 [Gyalolechia sp. 2 TL-2023]
MVRFPLTGLIIAATGDFGPRRSHETLKRWTEKNGGQWASEIDPGVTHLICTKEDYRSKAPMVKQALRLKLFTIVTYDWLEGELAPRGAYLVARTIKDAKKIKQVKKQTKKATIKKGDRYQVYRDSTHFNYDLVLVRVNLLQNKSERYVLRLCVTHDVPKYYASLLTYHTRESPAQKCVIAPVGSDWATAFGAFTSAFKAKTKVEWDERLKPRRPEEEAFVYSPPKDGEPRGEMPEDFNINVGAEAVLQRSDRLIAG